MKSTIRCILISLVMLAMAGCASEYNYTPPTGTAALNNSIVIDKGKDEVWKEIVPALGKTFFVINNLDKESGLINISYSGDPEKYVDCGRIHSLVSNLAGKRTYNFPASKAHQQYEILNNTGLWNIVRKMDLDGRMNIIVEELGPKQTKITANARYVLTKSTTQTGYLRVSNDRHRYDFLQFWAARSVFPRNDMSMQWEIRRRNSVVACWLKKIETLTNDRYQERIGECDEWHEDG